MAETNLSKQISREAVKLSTKLAFEEDATKLTKLNTAITILNQALLLILNKQEDESRKLFNLAKRVVR